MSKKSLEIEVAELRNKVEVTEKRAVERKALEDKKRKDELDFLKYQGQHLDSFLRQLGGSK
jgi:dynein light intermediate chain